MSENTGTEDHASDEININFQDDSTLKELNELKAQNKELLDRMTANDTARELQEFNTNKALKLVELKELHPALAEKHKNAKDLDTIQIAIDTAKAIKSDFPEFNDENTDTQPIKKNYITPTKRI